LPGGERKLATVAPQRISAAFNLGNHAVTQPRPPLIERQEYVPALPVEAFIVPLLRSEIMSLVDTFSYSAGSRRALDVGCGGQPFRRMFESRGYEYVSTDAQDPLGIVDYVAEIDGNLPPPLLERGPFDLVLCTEVLEHVADWKKAFANLATLLGPGGHLVVTCPFFYVLHETPYDFWRPTPFALRSFATCAGLMEVEVRTVGSSWDILGTLLGANRGTAHAADRSMSGRLLAPVLNILTKGGHWFLRRRWLQARVRWGSTQYPLYLSNVAVFTKPSCNTGAPQPGA
jgi:SAM-dependent methyltransferase